MSSTSAMPTNYDEVYMQETMLFSHSLKDLRTIRKQLYRAAEYFESSYTRDNDGSELLDLSECDVVDVLKEYAIKALVNTVDHLGYVTNKVGNLLDDQVDRVSESELRLSLVEQRLRSFQDIIDRKGRSQHSMLLDTPNYHKRYILPVGETLQGPFRVKSKYQGCCTMDDVSGWHQYKKAIQAKVQETPEQTTFSRSHSPLPDPKLCHRQNRVIFSDQLHNRNANTHPPLAAPTSARQQNNRVTFSDDLPNIERRGAPSPYRYTPPHSSCYTKGTYAVEPNTSHPFAPSRSRQTTPIRSRQTTPIRSRQTTPVRSRPTTSSQPTTPSRSRPTTPSRSKSTLTMTPDRDLTRKLYTSEVQYFDYMSVPVNEDREKPQSKAKARIKAFINKYKAKIDDHVRAL